MEKGEDEKKETKMNFVYDCILYVYIMIHRWTTGTYTNNVNYAHTYTYKIHRHMHTYTCSDIHIHMHTYAHMHIQTNTFSLIQTYIYTPTPIKIRKVYTHFAFLVCVCVYMSRHGSIFQKFMIKLKNNCVHCHCEINSTERTTRVSPLFSLSIHAMESE